MVGQVMRLWGLLLGSKSYSTWNDYDMLGGGQFCKHLCEDLGFLDTREASSFMACFCSDHLSSIHVLLS